MIRLINLSLSLLVAGCAGPGAATTPRDLRQSATHVYEFNLDAPLIEAYDVVAKNTIRCHQEHAEVPRLVRIIDPTFIVFRVNAPLSPNGKSAAIELYYRSRLSYGIIQLVDLASDESGGTSITVRWIDDGKRWQTAAESVEYWFSDNDNCWKTS